MSINDIYKSRGGRLPRRLHVGVSFAESGGGGGGNPPQGNQSPDGVTISNWAIRNTDSSNNSAMYVAHGLPAAEGDYPSGEFPLAVIGGTETPTQCEILDTWPDNSIKHALVAYSVGSINAAQEKAVVFDRTDVQPLGDNVDMTTMTNFSQNGISATIDGTPYAITIANMSILETIDGVVCQERTYHGYMRRVSDSALHPHLRGVINVRAFADGTAEFDFTIANTSTFVANPQGYDITNITANIRTDVGANVDDSTPNDSWILRQSRLVLHNDTIHSNHSDNTRTYVPIPDMNYLVTNSLVGNYELDNTPDESDITSLVSSFSSKSALGNVGMMRPNMPDTGGDGDLAPLTNWDSMWITSDGDYRVAEVCMGTARRGQIFNGFWEDETNGHEVTIIGDHPRFSSNSGVVSDPLVPDEGVNGSGTGSLETQLGIGTFAFDVAHQPQAFYLSYLVTAKPVYREAMLAWGMYNIHDRSPIYRGGDDGELGLMINGQQREFAWTWRTLELLAFILPSGHSRKSHCVTLFNNWNDWIVQNRIQNPWKEPLGYIGTRYDFNNFIPWQNDFFTVAAGAAYHRSNYVKHIESVTRWSTQFANRGNDAGYSAYVAPESLLQAGVQDPLSNSEYDDDRYHNWAAVLEVNHPSEVGSPSSGFRDGNLDDEYSYSAQQVAALAVAEEFGRKGAQTLRSTYKTAMSSAGADFTNKPAWLTKARSTGTVHPFETATPGHFGDLTAITTVSLSSVMPDSPNGEPDNSIFAFSGGALDEYNRSWKQVGGGHQDGDFNAVMDFDFDTLAWSQDSAQSTSIGDGTTTNPDGLPNSRHTNSSPIVTKYPDYKLYIAGSSPYPDGGGYPGFFGLDLETKEWTGELTAPSNSSDGAPIFCLDKTNNDLYTYTYSSNFGGLSKYDYDADTWEYKELGQDPDLFYTSMDYSPKHEKILMCCQGRMMIIDLASGLASATLAKTPDISFTGDTEIVAGSKSSCFYHPRLQLFCVYNLDVAPSAFFLVNPDTRVITRIDVAAGNTVVPNNAVSGRGVFNRVQYCNDYDIVILMVHFNDQYYYKFDYTDVLAQLP
jgi:hypothetical protein